MTETTEVSIYQNVFEIRLVDFGRSYPQFPEQMQRLFPKFCGGNVSDVRPLRCANLLYQYASRSKSVK